MQQRVHILYGEVFICQDGEVNDVIICNHGCSCFAFTFDRIICSQEHVCSSPPLYLSILKAKNELGHQFCEAHKTSQEYL